MKLFRTYATTIVVAMPVLVATPLAAGQVVCRYAFEDGTPGEAATVLSDSGPHANHGAGTSVLYSADVAGFPDAGAVSLDTTGDFNYGEMVDNPAVHLQEFTLRLYVKAADPYGTQGGGQPHVLAVKKREESGSAITSFGLWYSAATGEFRGAVSFGPDEGLGLGSCGVHPPGVWHDVALTMHRGVDGDLDTLALIVDGKVEDMATGAFPPIAYSSEEFLIGAGNFENQPSGTYRRNFNGWIDNVVLDMTPLAFNLCFADFDGSGDVAFPDLLAVLSRWGGADPALDLDCSGEVDFGDLLNVLSTWGDCG